MFGYIVGDSGTVFATTNGGNTWFPETTGVTKHLNAVSFVNDEEGFAVGQSGTVIATVDGGATWISFPGLTSGTLYDVQFLTLNLGWAVGDSGTIAQTADGGAQSSDEMAVSAMTSGRRGSGCLCFAHAFGPAEVPVAP